MSASCAASDESFTIRETRMSAGSRAVLRRSRASGIRKWREGFADLSENPSRAEMSPLPFSGISLPVSTVPRKTGVLEIDCYEVRRELSGYLDEDLTAELRLCIEWHLENCSHCRAVYEGVRNVVRLLADEKVIKLPDGFGRRLYARLIEAR